MTILTNCGNTTNSQLNDLNTRSSMDVTLIGQNSTWFPIQHQPRNPPSVVNATSTTSADDSPSPPWQQILWDNVNHTYVVVQSSVQNGTFYTLTTVASFIIKREGRLLTSGMGTLPYMEASPRTESRICLMVMPSLHPHNQFTPTRKADIGKPDV
jgi:hypothetical protein